MLLSGMLGSDVRTATGEIIGRLVDLTVVVGDRHPAVQRLGVGRRRRIQWFVAWASVAAFEHEDIRLTVASLRDDRLVSSPLEPTELRLERDVLDTQVIDVAGKRVARVSDVVLARGGDVLNVTGVELGAAGVWRRLGLGRLAAHATEQVVDWDDLHLMSARGHVLQLASDTTVVRRLGGSELAELVTHLPATRAADVLRATEPKTAAHAISATHPELGARLLRAVPEDTAASMVEQMAADDATAVLRLLRLEDLEPLLGRLGTERAATLRRLLTHRAGTAGGLMNVDVLTARAGDSIETIRARFSARPPQLEGHTVVFVLDESDRPIGSYEPSDLLRERPKLRAVPAISLHLPIDRVVDLFALHDYLAVPVIGDDGRLVGSVAVDDIMEELLAERLPGHGRFARIRRRRGRPLPNRLRPGPGGH